ncbi:related to RKM5 - protein lysine methyltransferase [Ustilago trichophora]|uniref:Related to RKM5 - protein lysine methyltransferase n=1 Tax=Ustilago trichophora TaxID=86804 RepID=A0A5C3EFQ3_9BASI|nr:related to RKM5 - protein lysine methyltransferase [Ustilago trichophora]
MPSHPHHHPVDPNLNDDDFTADDLPTAPNALLHVKPGRLVDDVDEEIFLLYTLNAKSEHDGGLGYVNHSSDKIYVAIDGTKWSFALSDRNLSGKLVVPIYQDVTSLRSSKGNTGSVLWRSTVELAIRFHKGAIFDLTLFKNASVLELGAGTGALPAMLSGLSKTWLATDQEELLPLMRKNLDMHKGVKVAPLDWFDFLHPPSQHSALLRKKHILDQINPASTTRGRDEDAAMQGVDVILCCDCIYNPGLFDALIATLNVFTDRQKTVVLVSCEMRSDESLAEFLTKWKASDPNWIIVSLEERFDKGFVALAAWKD